MWDDVYVMWCMWDNVYVMWCMWDMMKCMKYVVDDEMYVCKNT